MNTSSGSRYFVAAAVLAFGILSPACNTSPQAKEAKHLRKGKELRDKKDYSRALLEFKSASLAMPKDAEPIYQLGLTYLDAGDIRNGAGFLRKATELNPKHQQAQLKLAELMTTFNDKDVLQQAASRLSDVLSASPDNSEATD